MSDLAVTLTTEQPRAQRDVQADVRALILHWAEWLDGVDAVIRGNDVRVALGSLSWRYLDTELASVYFVRVVGREMVKIGMSTDVGRRVHDLQASSPDELELICELPGGKPLESFLHGVLRPLNVRREWFWLGYPILRLCEMGVGSRSGWAQSHDDGADEWASPGDAKLTEHANELDLHGHHAEAEWLRQPCRPGATRSA